MEYIIDIREEINKVVDDYLKNIEKELDKYFKKSLINMIIEEYKKCLSIEECEIDDFIKDKVKYLFKDDKDEIKTKIAKIINPIVDDYINILKESFVPPYLIFCSSIYLRNELETKHYFIIDNGVINCLRYIFDEKDKNKYINLWIFKKIIQIFCELFKEEIVFCDEFTKQFSLFTIDLMIKNFNTFIDYKKLELCMTSETRKKNFYEELYNSFPKILDTINKYHLSINNEILFILKLQCETSSLNVLSHVLFKIDDREINYVIKSLS